MYSVRSPAKLNLGLEILGRRPDGYHDIVTIFQAIDLYDLFTFEPTGRQFEYVGPREVPNQDDLVYRALMAADDHETWTGRLVLTKSIPFASGLGGGSSNAALALRLAFPERDEYELRRIALQLGADVPFFLYGGTALATGLGSNLVQLPTPEFWFVIVTPKVELANKTAWMFQSLDETDFSDGAAIYAIAECISCGANISNKPVNGFERQAMRFPEISAARRAILNAGASSVQLSGAGPSVYTICRERLEARNLAAKLSSAGWFPRIARTIGERSGRADVRAVASAMRSPD